ncbi:hypothetical protein GALMADRAFT_247545 [Galerina marginata CBS 339.88]|uniref:Carbohydrate kinase PfkB domain-containing protein n=1 Tax=Galerina marginata (strain CBS 339.88) TaxID=685588 RepID=A0A067T8K2_GALM3|nr:hypothetical protein GALMADRAFT_247545 [Galerina marginata CBS 339.88]
MTKLRRERSDDNQNSPMLPPTKPLRIVASGTLFQTHTLSVPCHPVPSTVIRAHSVEKARGGSANMLLSLLAQFPAVESVLVAPLSGNEEGRMILRDLENEGVMTKYCKIWRDAGVPSAWVLHSAEDNTRTVVNHNPLPDITHEDFVSLLGPLLAPENFPQTTPTLTPVTPSYASSASLAPPPVSTPRTSQSGPRPPTTPILYNPNSPAPFDWLHFEGRSVKTTLSNMTGLDGLARERKWRSHCVFSVDVGRKGRQGVEALIPHADVLFFNKHYAQANSPHFETTPRAFLLSLASIASPHALLVAHWGKEGGAVLSLPTKEYFQSSGWVEERPPPSQQTGPDGRLENPFPQDVPEVRSVRSGSEFWADGRSRTPSSRAFTAGGSMSMSHYMSDTGDESRHQFHRARSHTRQGQGTNESSQYTTTTNEEDDNDSQGTERPGGDQDADDGVVDEVGAQDAFIAGMIFALSRRVCPGLPYTPAWTGEDVGGASGEDGRGRWRLDECLRFATELSGRKARQRGWTGLADEMIRAGWMDS